MKTITINDVEYNVYGYNEIADHRQPHITIASSGEMTCPPILVPVRELVEI